MIYDRKWRTKAALLEALLILAAMLSSLILGFVANGPVKICKLLVDSAALILGGLLGLLLLGYFSSWRNKKDP